MRPQAAEALVADVETEGLAGRNVMSACAQVDPPLGESLVAQGPARRSTATDNVCRLVCRSRDGMCYLTRGSTMSNI